MKSAAWRAIMPPLPRRCHEEPFAAMRLFPDAAKETLLSTLGIEITEASKERVVGRMPVGPKVHQPFGLLHGGASVALAESAASLGAILNCDMETQSALGIEINAN